MMVSDTGTQQKWYGLHVDEVLEGLCTEPQGLRDEEAETRLDQYGRNTIQEQAQVSAWNIILKQFKSPLIYILLLALMATVAMQRWSDAIVIAIVLVVNGTIGFFQEYRAEHAIQELMSMVSPKANVRRDGHIEEIDSAEIVPGDIVVVNEGDVVPADLRIIESNGLQTNEAALTGESVPVSKTHEAMAESEENLPPADQENCHQSEQPDGMMFVGAQGCWTRLARRSWKRPMTAIPASGPSWCPLPRPRS